MSAKQELLDLITKKLLEEFQTLDAASKAAKEAATHEESKPEDQYDTRGLEASYLAGAQAQRAQEISRGLGILKQFPLKDFSAQTPIQSGALLELLNAGRKSWYFLLPAAAGTSLEWKGKSITVLSPVSKLGEELMGRRQGEEFLWEQNGQEREIKVLSIC